MRTILGYNVSIPAEHCGKEWKNSMKNRFLKKVLSREFLVYLTFGLLTTAVNYVVFTVMLEALGGGLALVANAIAFVAAVLVAFLTNKPFVFKSKSWHWKVVAKEFLTFLGSRLATFCIEEAGLFICQNALDMDRWKLLGLSGLVYAKLGLSVIVVLLNYVISKWLVFRKGGEESEA